MSAEDQEARVDILYMQAQTLRTGGCSLQTSALIAGQLKLAVAGGLTSWAELEITKQEVDTVLAKNKLANQSENLDLELLGDFLDAWGKYKQGLCDIKDFQGLFLEIRKLLAQQKLRPEHLEPFSAGDWFELCQSHGLEAKK